jgi:hypothetical protein
MIERHLGRNRETGERIEDPAIGGLARAMKLAREKAATMAAVSDDVMADTTQTPAANAIRAHKRILDLANEVTAALDKARDHARAEVAKIEQETSAPPVPRDAASLQLEGETRTWLRTLPDDKRAAAVETALNAGDDLTVGALLRGPAGLSGISPATRELYRGQWRERRFPDQTARMRRIGKAVADVERGGKALLRFVRDLTESPTAQIAAAAQERAAKTLQAAE